MISVILQHLESLQIDLTAIDPSHRTNAVDEVAAIASALRQTVSDESDEADRAATESHYPWASRRNH